MTTEHKPHSEPQDDVAYANTDRELWRDVQNNPFKHAGDYYADSIHVTEQGGIGINVGGTVYVRTLREWHGLEEQKEAADRALAVADQLAEWCRVTTSVEGVFSNNLGAQAQAQGMASLVVRYVATRESYPAIIPHVGGATEDVSLADELPGSTRSVDSERSVGGAIPPTPDPATDSPSVLDSSIDIEGAEAGWTGAPDPASEPEAS